MKRLNNKTRGQAGLMRPCLLASAIGLALMANPAQAIDLSRGDVSISLDTTISFGSGMRVSDRDDDLVGKSRFNPVIFAAPPAAQEAQLGRFSANSDDGNLNFDDGDFIFNAARVTSELSVDYKNYGFFVRGNYFYDFTLNDKDFLSEGAKDRAGSRARLLDAFAYTDIEVGERLLSLRLGRQVVSWGESTFIPSGINVINPVDITALRTAGSELRDAFLPQNMIWGSIDLTPNLSVEGLVLMEWDQVEPEPSGTFFSTNDFGTTGGRYAMLNFGLVPQPIINPDLFDEVCGQGNFGASDRTDLSPELVAVGCSAAFPRGSDIRPDTSGQFGLAFRYFADWLNDTEFGLYYLRYHSRLPLLSGEAVLNSDVSTGAVRVEYPEDIDLLGLSFNTTIPGGWSLAGELSYRDNVPIQIDDVELLFAGLSPLNGAIPNEYERFRSQLGQYEPGEFIPGYERRQASQMQFTFTKLFGPNNFIGANQIATVAEFGATHYWDLPGQNELRFEGPGTDTGGGPDRFSGAGRNPLTNNDGYATAFSWGYRMVIAPTYNSIFGTPWNMTPRIAFNHDVQGVSPGPGGNFIEGRKQLTLGVNFDYLSTWRVGFGYTNFFGAGINNLLSDRDFVSASVSYSF
ncbi:MAG: DUF1302 domain-containing protein [Pseudomonadota bacterium]